MVGVVQERNSHALLADRAVAVDLDFAFGIHNSDSAEGWSDFLDGSIVIEIHILGPDGAVLVEIWRQILIMIKQVPLPFVFDHGLMHRPATARRFIENDALRLVRSHWTFADGILEALGIRIRV